MEIREYYTYFFLVDGYPVSCGIPFVTLDVVDTILQIPVALSQVYLQ